MQEGDTFSSIEQAFGVPLSLIASDNGIDPTKPLVVGQALVLRFPALVHTVQLGDTLSSIAREYGISLRALYRNNPALEGQERIWQGQTLVISYRNPPTRTIRTNAYAYPSISERLLHSTLPFLSYLTPFTYGFTSDGALIAPSDNRLISAALSFGTAPLMHLSTLTENGTFSNELAHLLLNDTSLQEILLQQIIATLRNKGYRGLDVDFEYVFAEDSAAYAAFLGNLTQALNPLGYPVIAALAPKISDEQQGTLYEGHDYSVIGGAVNEVLLMTYEWGYTYGPPMAVAPLHNVRQVVEYALTQIAPSKIWLGIPNYGYDWTLPYVRGESRATSISGQQALSLARQYGAVIQYDERAQTPWFRYFGADRQEHEVWFEDARSIQAKLGLISEYGLTGAGYWNLMRDSPQNWTVLNALYHVIPAALS